MAAIGEKCQRLNPTAKTAQRCAHGAAHRFIKIDFSGKAIRTRREGSAVLRES